MAPKVSVIIPIYNVQEYLDRCVQSVFSQSLTDLEIILVDDGSPDNCPKMCDAYKNRDDRVKVIHKVNGGLSSARNAGLNIATGEYVFFLDSDDWLEPDGMEHLCKLGDEYNVDFVRYRAIRTGWPGMPENTPCMLEEPREIPGGLYDKNRILKEIYPKLMITPQITFGPILGAWGSLYKREFLKKYNICFYEDIKYSEDILFSANVVRNAESFFYDDTAGVYHYFYNDKSISKSFRFDRWNSCKNLIEKAYKDFSDDSAYDFKKQLNLLTWFCILLSLGDRRFLQSKKERMDYCKMIINDKIVRDCDFIPDWYEVGLKQNIFIFMIKIKLWWLVAEV